MSFDFEGIKQNMPSFKENNTPQKGFAPEKQPPPAVKLITSVITLCVLAAFIPVTAHLLLIIGQWSWNLL
jgi:hypothetical protein